MSTFLSYCCCGQNRTFGVLFIYFLLYVPFFGWLLLEDEPCPNHQDHDFDPLLSDDPGKCPLIHIGPIFFLSLDSDCMLNIQPICLTFHSCPCLNRDGDYYDVE